MAALLATKRMTFMEASCLVRVYDRRRPFFPIKPLLAHVAVEMQFALFGGVAWVSISALFAFVVPVVMVFFLSLPVGRALVRTRAPTWLATAEREFGVPATQLRWVLGGAGVASS